LSPARVGDHGLQRELERARIVHGYCLGVLRGLDDSVDGAEASILGVDAKLSWYVRRSMPELDVCIDRTAVALKRQLHALGRLIAKVPRFQRAALHEHRLVLLPHVSDERAVFWLWDSVTTVDG
jgi:hypothetical protein